MGIIKVQCSCGMLWLSETLGGYDTICDHDGKICGAVNYQDEQFQIIQPEECKKHKMGHNERTQRGFATS